MPKLIAFMTTDDREKVYINPAYVAVLAAKGVDQTTILVAAPQGRQQYTVGGPVDEIAFKINHAMD